MRIRLLLGILSFTIVACGGGTSSTADSSVSDDDRTDSTRPRTNTGGRDAGSVDTSNPLTDPEAGPAAGNPAAPCAIPPEAGPEDVSSPDHVIGDGTSARVRVSSVSGATTQRARSGRRASA